MEVKLFFLVVETLCKKTWVAVTDFKEVDISAI